MGNPGKQLTSLMTTLKNILALVAIYFFSVSISLAAESQTTVAKINYSEIQALLEAVVLSAPGNQELEKQYKAAKSEQKAAERRMQKALMNGERFDPLEAASGVLNRFSGEPKILLLCEKRLVEVVEQLFKDKYDLILKGGYRSSLLYSRIAIDDVTSLVKQQLLKDLSEE